VLSIKDDGVGMSSEDKKHVFEKFWRSRAVKNSQGTGLGLFIARELLKLMQGDIWCESEEGKGTTLYISLTKSNKQNH